MLDFDRCEVMTFDCYGTLIDWETGIINAVRPVLERHHVDIDDEELLEQYGRAESKYQNGNYLRYEVILRLVMTELARRFGFNATDDEAECFEESLTDWRPFPDTVEALRILKKRFKLGVISNIDDRLFALSAVHLEVPFDFVFTAQQARAYKPSLQVFQFAIDAMGVRPERILHVAQSLYHDIVPATALGLPKVWINRRRGKRGFGATRPAEADPELELADLITLARMTAR